MKKHDIHVNQMSIDVPVSFKILLASLAFSPSFPVLILFFHPSQW
jgi:hypothetical protein